MPAGQVGHRNRILFAAGALLGIAVFLLVFGGSSLDVTNDAFCRGGYMEKDIQQHYAGWLFYRESSTTWPLCVADSINAPDGLSVAYTDSIPLAAALLRPMAAALGGTFQYFGWFTLLCYALQGGFGALLCGLFANGLAAPLLGDLLFVTSPVLLERAFRHTSLGAQFLILGALYYYFKLHREGRYASAGLFVLNLVAIGIHPYFLPMTYAVTLALLLEHGQRTRHWGRPALYLAADLGCTLGLGWCLGLFYGTASSGGQALYGYFSMNLNALWNPVGVNGVCYSRVLPVLNQVNGNYDAFAYLGLGILVALPVALVLDRCRWLRRLREHWTLVVVCAILTVFAVTNVITANGATLATLPLPEVLIRLFSIFRSSGRLFWPVYDLLMLVVFSALARLQGKGSVAALAVLVAVQIWDISPAMIQRSDAMASAQTQEAFPSALQSDFWEQAQNYRHIASMDGIQDDALHLALFAADNEMTTNDPFAARYSESQLTAQRQELSDELATGTLREDTLYLFAEEGTFLQAVEPVRSGAWCGRVTGGDGQSCWYVIAPGLQDAAFDSLCVAYDENYPLRLADYTDGLWNRGVLDKTKRTVCFADAPFTRRKLEGATALCAGGKEYKITNIDDHDPGWLMVTLEIEDATVLWDQELETKSCRNFM